MARHVVSEAKVGPKAVRKRKPKGLKVKRVDVTTRQLVVVGPTHLAWSGPTKKPAGWLPTCSNMFKTKGSIVKLIPRPGTPEDHVESMERSFYEGGARSVRVMPVQEDVKVSIAGVEFDFSAVEDERPLRQVVTERGERMTNSHDHGALMELLTMAMDHAENPT